ncbi:tRNA lysidine(34) synthetase TilS [Lutimonas zeaxanthinifaciens]|uniref:tRNA lysidine(34) synthetase TilS n=1 Tax=Lutimonas zeaxanthinifaciens TaxID=3060215 RepID=UPI00265D0687|nr:tRNA lysidine(34) synthetase TilS [Lutimonas sp. YSD2104]WKK65981.1 tRNA lysidine(34) synthetase TilS [Lutimonas sp. YSD2104]
MIEKFHIHLKENFPEIENKETLLAVSGGIDSMVLLHLMSALKVKFSVAHCNFGLRNKESDLDEEFVREQTEALDKRFYVKKFDTLGYASKNKLSIQMAARELRYTWFHELMNQKGYEYLLTAHHADDNLETFIINLSRGTGIDGLTGIPERRDKLLRPLLAFNREDIRQYALNNDLPWREDHTNAETKYLRNKIRKEIVPLLKELNPSFLNNFAQTVENLKGTKSILQNHIESVREKAIVQKDDSGSIQYFSTQTLKELSENTAYLYELFYPYGFTNYKDLISLLEAQPGKQILSETHRLIKDRKTIILTPKTTISKSTSLSINEDQTELESEGVHLFFKTLNSEKLRLSNVGDGKNTACFDKDLLTFPLHVRKWEKGDYFYPLGMKGKKKLSKFFKDEKYSLLEKENIWLLCSGSDIVWIIGKRMDDRFRVTGQTKEILKAAIQS